MRQRPLQKTQQQGTKRPAAAAIAYGGTSDVEEQEDEDEDSLSGRDSAHKVQRRAPPARAADEAPAAAVRLLLIKVQHRDIKIKVPIEPTSSGEQLIAKVRVHVRSRMCCHSSLRL